MPLRTIFIIIGFTALVYFGLLTQIRIFGAVPNLLMLLIIIVATEVKDGSFIPAALLAGLITDLYLGTAVGTFTGGLLLAGFISYGFFNRLHYGFTWKHQLALIFSATVLISLWAVIYSNLLFSAHLPVPVLGWKEALRTLIPATLYNLLAFYLMLRWFKAFQIHKPFIINPGLAGRK